MLVGSDNVGTEPVLYWQWNADRDEWLDFVHGSADRPKLTITGGRRASSGVSSETTCLE